MHYCFVSACWEGVGLLNVEALMILWLGRVKFLGSGTKLTAFEGA